MGMKTALITGTSTGLGISIAIQLAKGGYKVYATMRNLEKKAALLQAASQADVSLELLRLDVQDAASIQACVDEIMANDGYIDVLVNNAGCGFIRTTEHASEEEVAWVMDVNFKGVVRCTKAVLPHMRAQGAGHIVNITSVGGLVGQPFNEFYCAAKFAVEGYTEALATYVGSQFGIKFSLVEPGGIKSEFANNALKQFQAAGGMPEDAYKPILEKYVGGAGDRQTGGIYQTTDEVAAVVIECIASDNPPLRVRTSTWAESFCRFKTDKDPTGQQGVAMVVDTFL